MTLWDPTRSFPTRRTCDRVMFCSVVLQLTLFLLCCSCSSATIDAGSDPVFHNQFALYIPNATEQVVADIAVKHGFKNLGQIGALDGYFLFEHERIHKRSVDRSDIHHENLSNEPGVVWVQQQFEKKRIKRDFALNQPRSANFAAGTRTLFPDPFYSEQWYLHGGSQEGFDMNVIPAWRKGYTGRGVVVSILDDGIQTNHPDLAQNYDPLASTDINDNDNDPMPRDNGDNKHGTRCAGEIAAVAFNSYCGVGIAYNASIGGVRMLDGSVNDAVEARALNLNPDHIDIYSASWGPEDDGKTVDGPGPLAKRAFINGIMKGRKGKGSIFVWASGNGGRHEDSCNCDGYTNSIFTLSISSATQGGFKPWYLEECSSTLATTYSSGRPDLDRSIATVDMDGGLRPEFLCTSEHTGTSASAPLAAGICALALEANPNLTWRDMQHLVVFTSRPDPLHDNGWVTNGIGKKVSHKFGYGLMDAGAMVTLAEQWTNVPAQHVCQTPADLTERTIPNGFGQKLEVIVETDACTGSAHEIRFLEHVQCRISLRFAPRGNLRIRLTSPSGTPTVLLFERPRDVLEPSFEDWPFMSVHFWGERAAGRWKLEIINAGNKRVSKAGILKKWQLVFYGTDTNPVRLRSPQVRNPGPTPFAATGITGRAVGGASSVNTQPVPTQLNNRVRGQVFFPGTVRQGPFTTARLPDFLQFSGSENVAYRTTPDAAPVKPDDVSCVRYSLDGMCVDSCPGDYFVTPEMRCQKCHGSCSSCSGSGLENCLSCNPTFAKMIDSDLCVEKCPERYHFDSEKLLCIPCPAQCDECDSSLQCTKCQVRLVLHDGQCFTSCLAGYYETDDDECAPCSSSCATCRGPLSHHCVTCAESAVEFNGTCVEECPSRCWKDSANKQCLPCPTGCESCSLMVEGDFGVVCNHCSSGWLLDISSRSCLTPSINICNDGEYISDGKCLPCHGSCQKCTGPSSSECTNCHGNVSIHQGSCVAVCPQGTFSEQVLQSTKPVHYCRPCSLSCAQCEGLDRCTECLGGLHLQNGQCLVACEDGHYSDRGICVRCHESCTACSGPLATDCMRCSAGFSWLQLHCLSGCPLGYLNTSATSYAQVSNLSDSKTSDYLCAKCDPRCAECDVDVHRCSSCADGFAFNNSSCVSASTLREVPLLEFVKEAEGRGSRAQKTFIAYDFFHQASSLLLPLFASLIILCVVAFVIVQVKSRVQNHYVRVPLDRSQESGADKLLLSSDAEDEESDPSLSKV